MKSVLILAGILSFSSVFASTSPSVGDSATYHTVLTQGTAVNDATSVNLITAIDAAAQTANVQTTTSALGQSNVENASNPLADLAVLSESEIAAECASVNGQGGIVSVTESITVAAGTFQTCHITLSSADGSSMNQWIASVPFGFAKAIIRNADGSSAIVELTAFKKN